MKRKNNRKGFTIVELVIVIAVIGILATVLVPTFGDVISSAKESAAKQGAKNAYTTYLVEHSGTAAEVMVYKHTNGKVVALENGVPVHVYETEAEFFAAYNIPAFTMNENTLYTTTGEAGSGDSGSGETEEPTDWSGAKAIFIGDSITNGVGTTAGKCYYDYLKNLLSLGAVTEEGVSGACFSVTSDYGDGNVQGKDYRPPLTYRVTGKAGNLNLQKNTTIDLVVVFLGTNDYGHDTPMGSITDTTDTSFYGAMNVAIPKLRELYPNAQLVFMTPLHRDTDTVYNSSVTPGVSFTKDTDPNGRGLILKDYVDAIETVCQKNSIPVINLFDLCELEPKNKTYFTDGLHPTAAGNEEIAKVVAEELKKIHRNDAGDSEDEDDTDAENPVFSVQLGSKYASGQEMNTFRASSVNSVYLRKGTVIQPTDASVYAMAVYATNEEATQQGTSLASWNTPYTIQNDGYYGLVFKRVDGAAFKLGETDSGDLYEYVTIAFPVEYGSKYIANPNSNKNRASSTTCLNLQNGDVVTAKSGYKVAVYKEGEYTSLTGGFKNAYTIAEEGSYGIVICKDPQSDFNFESGDSKNLYDYVTIE